MYQKMKNENHRRMKTFWRNRVVGVVSIFLCTFLYSSVSVQAMRLSPDKGNVVENHIYDALQTRYKGSLQRVNVPEGTESYLQLLVTFEKHQLPDIILVVNVLDRSIDEVTGKVLSNIIQLQVFPQIQPLLPKERERFMRAVIDWQYSHVLPQLAYLTPENRAVYGWGIPLYDEDSLDTDSLAQIIDELASSWIEFGRFLKENVGEPRKLRASQKKIISKTDSGSETFSGEDTQENTIEKVQSPTYSMVETLTMLPGGRGMRAESQKKFTTFIENIKADSNKAIIIRGYVSSDKDTKENVLLSRKRAENVAQMILDAGVQSVRVSAEGMGIQNPVASNATAEGRDKNRRVEIFLQD